MSQIAVIVDDVWKELGKEGACKASVSPGPGRSFMARKVFQLAKAQWSATQIKELLLKAVRNEISQRRRKDSAAPAQT